MRSVEEKPYTSRPKPPFMTSTLQQEGGRKLRMSSAQVMRVAQDLYQNGYITYMRTDSTTLSETALPRPAARSRELYGADYVPGAPAPTTARSRTRRRPTRPSGPAGETFRTPESLRGELRGDQLRLYELIWKRTVASQMVDARGQSRVRSASGATGSATAPTTPSSRPRGRSITFPGYLRAYVEGTDDPDAALDDRETLLPVLTVGQALPPPELEAKGHATSPPARFTEASLVKRLEELGIGRPSTYASIMQTIQDRGYVWKKGTALVPTWTAFAVIRLLEEHFGDLVDYDFTAAWRTSSTRSPAARSTASRGSTSSGSATDGETGRRPPGSPGLKALVERGKDDIDPAEINSIPHRRRQRRRADRGPAGQATGPTCKRGEDTRLGPRRPGPRRARRGQGAGAARRRRAATGCSAPTRRPAST